MIKKLRLTFGSSARRRMPYNQYLKSNYWKRVRVAKLRQVDHCQLCRSFYRLEIHHNTYENRGDELKHLDNLTVLCHDCHDHYHNG